MIQYTLKCENGHSFDSWFRSANAFDALVASGHVSCAECSSKKITKGIMAPRITASRSKAVPVGAELEIAKIRKHVEENADYVGGKFADEARSMHSGTAPERAIYGEANLSEAKALIEEGIPVAPLPFIPKAKAN